MIVKKVAVTITMLIILTFMLPSTHAYFFNITPDCGQQCISGNNMTWVINLTNEGAREIKIVDIEILENGTNKRLLLYNGTEIVIEPTTQKLMKLKSQIPYSTDNKLQYYPCFNFKIPPQIRFYRNVYFGIYNNYCYQQDYSFEVFECAHNSTCSDQYSCVNNICVKLECTYCQYAANNECFDMECCADWQCSTDKICQTNDCQQLNCSSSEGYFNHTCIVLNCLDDEIIQNHQCIKLECGNDETAKGNKCVQLNCEDDESVEDEICKKLECAQNEFSQNHTCSELQCGENEVPRKHVCREVECFFFQKKHDRECVLDTAVLKFSAYEFIALIEIAALLLILRIELRKKSGKSLKNKKRGVSQDES